MTRPMATSVGRLVFPTGQCQDDDLYSNSSIGGGGHNEITMEDAKGDERLYVQAQNAMDTLVKEPYTSAATATRRSAGMRRTR